MTDMTTEWTALMQRIVDRATNHEPDVESELASVKRAREQVWNSDVRAMLSKDIGQRALVWRQSLCRKPDDMLKAARACVQEKRSIIIQGPIGTGKTTMAVHILISLAAHGATAMQRDGFDLPEPERFLYAVRSEDLFRSLAARYGEAKERADAIMDRAKHVNYLFIDDLGREAEEPESFAAFQAVMDYRYAHERPVIVATNLTQAEYDPGTGTTPAGAKAHWAAIISRWKQTAAWINLDGDDLRKR